MNSPLSVAKRSLAILVCFLIAVVEGFDIQAFGVAAPKLIPAFGLTPSQMGWAASAAMIGLVIGAFGGGWLADRTGRKPILLWAVIIFGLCSLWTAFATDYAMLLAARFACGIGFGAAMPNLIAIATEISSPKRRVLTTSFMFCGVPLGGAIVSLIARSAGADLDWPIIFIIGGIFPLALAPVIYFLLPETRPDIAVQKDQPKLLVALLGRGRLVPTLLLWSANLLTLLVVYLLLNWLPTLIVAKGHTLADGATASFSFNIIGIVGALLLGVFVDKVGFRWSLIFAYVALALTMWAISGLTDINLILALSGAAGFLVLGSQYAIYGLAPRLYDPSARAAGAGAAVAVGRFGAIVGPLLAGELRGVGWSAGDVFLLMIPVALAAGISVFVLTFLTSTEAR